MADEVASLLVRITADGSQAVGVLNGVASTVDTLANRNAALLNKVSSVGTLAGTVGGTITKTFGVATVAGLTASAKAAGQLNKELANIGTLSVPTERLKEFKGQIQDIAIDTAKSTSDISEGTYQVISAFGDAPDTMKKVEINAKAAKAGLATTADSIALTSAVTKAYGDTSAGAVQHVADLAFKTVELGQTTFPELAQNMQQVTSLSKELGVSQEELFGAYATLTGVTGNAAEVQTQIKAVYTALLKPSENMTAAIKKQGYESGYAMIKAKGFAGTLNALKEATGGSEEEMLGLFNNVRAMPAVMALTGSQADTFAAKLEKMEKASGAATKAFEVQTEGVSKTGYTLEQAKVKMQVAAQRFGESAAPLIGDVADIVDRASTSLANLTDEQRQSIINTGVMTTKIGVGLAVGGKALTLGTKILGTAKAIGEIVGGGSIDTFGFWAEAAGGAGSLTAGLLAPAAVVGAYKIIAEHVTEAIENNSKLGQSYKELYDTWTEADDKAEHISSLRDEYDKLNQSINSGKLSGEELESAKDRTAAIIEEIKGLVDDDTIKLMIDTGDYEAALDLAVTDAKNAADEIKDALNYGDYKEAKKSVSEAYGAINAGEDYGSQYKERREAAREWLQEAASFEEQYNQIQDNMRKASAAGNGEWLKSLATMRNELIKSVQDSGFADTYKSLTGSDFKFGDMDEVISQVQSVRQAYSDLSENIAAMDERAENGRQSLQAMAQVAQESAIDFSGYENIQEVFAAGGNAINNTIAHIKSTMSEWGFENADIASQVALFRNGFESLQQAIDANALDAVVRDFISDGEKLGMTGGEIAAKAALMKNGFSDLKQAVSSGDIKGVINDLGSIGGDLGMSVAQIDALAHSLGLIPENKRIQISADGEIKIIDEVKEKVEDLPDEHNTDINATDNTSEGVESAKRNIESVKGKTVEITTVYKTVEDSNYNKFYTGGSFAVPKAKGDSNFRGGNALLNDDGSKDPRELIMYRGAAWMYNEPNVIANIPEGATILTSSQTKAKLRSMGIKSYATGKNNSDAFTSARDDWTHYTKTHSVTTAQELEKWLEFQRQYKDNEKDIWDIEEQVFSLQTKLYSERVRESENWLSHETKYNGMSAADYIAGIDRMKSYTAEYYAQGIINYKEYTEALNDLDEKRLDKVKEGLSKQFDASKAYISEHTYFNDWQDNGDDPLAAYNRVTERNREALANGELTQEEFDEYAKTLGADMYSERREQSGKWLDEQRKYFGMEADEYVAGLERQKQYTEEYYRKGLIDRRTYNEGMTELNHAMWDETAAAYDDMLSQQREYISDLQEQFSKQEQELRDSWEVADRKTDMSEVSAQLDIYAGAVTDRGQQKYKELEEQMLQLQRDEELYNLQVKNNAVIEQLQADYEQAEDMKTDVLKSIAQANVDISGIVSNMTANIENAGNGITSLLSQLLNAFNNFQINAPSTTYVDGRTVTVNGVSSGELGRFMGGMR